MRIVLGNSNMAKYPLGGGHWSWFLQFPLALRALGHEVFWLELANSSGDDSRDEQMAATFLSRLAGYGLAEQCALILLAGDLKVQQIEQGRAYCADNVRVKEVIADADLLLNFSCALRRPLLSMFKRRALLDFDPGHLQLSFPYVDLGQNDHDFFLTLGARINAPDCGIPAYEFRWRPFEPLIYLPMWDVKPPPRPESVFTSITQWTWEELPYRDGLVSASKRAAYMKYADLPQLLGHPVELAANIGQHDPVGDRAALEARGWRICDPHRVVPTPEKYAAYIGASLGEFMCPKPLHCVLKTGWFSDRSLAYLASGRPVVAEDTGFSERIPTGEGLLAFTNIDEAAESIRAVASDYARHSRKARELAADHFDWRRNIATILAACGY